MRLMTVRDFLANKYLLAMYKEKFKVLWFYALVFLMVALFFNTICFFSVGAKM